MMSISTRLFGKISHASLFITGQLRNPWQMLAEPWGRGSMSNWWSGGLQFDSSLVHC